MIEIFWIWFNFDCMKIFTKIRIGIWETMSKINLVIIIVESMGECESIVFFIWETISSSLVFYMVLKVFDICANSMPAKIFRLWKTLAIRQDSHTLIIQAVGFRKIYYVKSNFLPFFGIWNTEKIPLCMYISVNIVLQN